MAKKQKLRHPIKIGDKVQVTDKVLQPRDFPPASRIHAKPSAIGVVTDSSDSHGLCFEVEHEDGTSAWYNPDELFRIGYYACGHHKWEALTIGYLTENPPQRVRCQTCGHEWKEIDT